MDSQNNYSYNYSFTGRCAQIKDAQWVCHAIHSTMPHLSTTKFKPAFTKLYFNTFPGNRNTPHPQTIYELKQLLDKITLTKDDYNQLGLFKKLKFKIERKLCSKETEKNLKILTKVKEFILNMGIYRNQYKHANISSIEQTLNLLEQHKIGNCQEDAILAEFILKMNGLKNATTATLINGSTQKQLDHSVCIINKDGSPFNGKVSNKTIIIDPWAGKADFAKNMIPFYKNIMTNSFNVCKDTNIEFLPIETVHLTETQMNLYKQKYKNFVHKNSNRKFMQSQNENKKP